MPNVTTGSACKTQNTQHMQCAALDPKVTKAPLGSSAAMYARMQAYFLQQKYLRADCAWHETPAVSSTAHLADWTWQSVHLSPFVAVRPEIQSQVSLTDHKFLLISCCFPRIPWFFILSVSHTNFCGMPTHRVLGIQQQLNRHRLQVAPAER